MRVWKGSTREEVRMETKHVQCCLASGLKGKYTHLRMDGFWMKGWGEAEEALEVGGCLTKRWRGRGRKILLIDCLLCQRGKWAFLHTSGTGSSPQWSQLPSQTQRPTMVTDERGERPNSGMAASQTDDEAQLHTSVKRLSSFVRNPLPFLLLWLVWEGRFGKPRPTRCWHRHMGCSNWKYYKHLL